MVRMIEEARYDDAVIEVDVESMQYIVEPVDLTMLIGLRDARRKRRVQ